MAILFGDYELVAGSGLFDAVYYLETNPDIAALNVDPLLHYVESGCRDQRDPSAGFDTAHYLKLCETLGEKPVNALVHYLTVGMMRGLTPSGQSVPGAGMLCIDLPRITDGRAAAPVRGGLSIVGWCLAPGGGASVDIALDGVRVTTARCGIRRPDVAAAHPQWKDSLLSGFAAHLPASSLSVGRHAVTVRMHDAAANVSRTEFQIEVEDVPDDRGPWALRRKMRRAEVDQHMDTLDRLGWRPYFRVYLTLAPSGKSITAARLTLETLVRQTYTDWELCLVPVGVAANVAAEPAALKAALIDGFDDIGRQIRVAQRTLTGAPSARDRRTGSIAERLLTARLLPGDEFGCDALLQFALAGAFDRSTELWYSDERRPDPVAGNVEAFFKPAWSPDLHLATNYLGRAWCAQSGLLERAGIGAKEFGEMGDYDLSLRLAEAAHGIGHIPKILFQRAPIGGDSGKQERRALADALRRRKVGAQVESGCLAGHYRIKRKRTPGRVSVIIPTCATGGLIKTCIETLRARTAHHAYEIICIENIPATRQRWKGWLRANADAVIETGEPFNWSQYNNRAANRATGKFLLFLNDDIEVIEPDWLGALVEQAQRPEVGVVGPLLLYPDRSVQQAGVMLDGAGRGRHAFRHLEPDDPGYFGLALTQRNVISVTGACLLTRRETFDSLGGFDETHPIINNDLDYCLRAREKDLVNVYTPHSRLIHHELASRSHLAEIYDVTAFNERWRHVIATGDPYFNRNLSRDHEPFTIEREPFELVYAGHPLFARSAVQRILVVKLDHIGDCITALAALRRLKRCFPAARISVLAGCATLAIWRTEAVVDEVIEFNYFHARSGSGTLEVTARQMAALAGRLRPKRFDLAIDLRKQPDTRFILQHTGAGLLVGFDTHGRFPWLDVALEWDEDVPLRSKHGNIADDLLALVEAVATHSDADRRAGIETPSGAVALPGADRRRLFSKPLICVHPASGSPMRQWPPHKFSRLIDMLLDESRFNVALIGGADEKDVAGKVLDRVERAGEVIDLTGLLTMPDLQRLIAASVLFVGNNSGPQHLAAGLGIATIGIHSGVVDAREWGPSGPRAVAVRRNISCSPCFIEQPKDCPRNLECLTELTVADVYSTCREMLLAGRPTAKSGAGSIHPEPLST